MQGTSLVDTTVALQQAQTIHETSFCREERLSLAFFCV